MKLLNLKITKYFPISNKVFLGYMASMFALVFVEYHTGYSLINKFNSCSASYN